MYQQGKTKLEFCWTSINNKKSKVFLRTYAHSQFLRSSARCDLANRGVRRPVQPHTFYARLLVFDKTLAQTHFAVVTDALMSLFYSPVFMRSLMFLQS